MKICPSAKVWLVLRAFLIIFVFGLTVHESAFSQSHNFRAISTVKTNFISDFNDDEREIFELVNVERRKKRLKNVDWNDDLSRVARKYSQQMAKGNFFGHFDKSGRGMEERADAAKINWSQIGENLYFREGIGDFNFAAVKGWMQSPSHRENILTGNWTETGVGVAESRDGKIYITQLFITN